jgi:lysine-N-methylase
MYLMQLVFHHDIQAKQKYQCLQCAKGCQTFAVPLREGEGERIEKLRDWRKQLSVKQLFVKQSKLAGGGEVLAKDRHGRCLFLGKDNLCEIHRDFGLQAKPLACQLYPFVLSPLGGTFRVGLRYDCPATARSSGRSLGDYQGELKVMVKALLPKDISKSEYNDIVPNIKVNDEVDLFTFDAINDTLVDIIGSDAMPLKVRLLWLHKFMCCLEKIKWGNVVDEEVGGMIDLLKGASLKETIAFADDNVDTAVTPPSGKPRKLLGQIFFLLSQSSIDGLTATGLAGITQRFGVVRKMGQLVKLYGPLPKVQPDWPDCDLQALEVDFAPMDKDVSDVITRYLIGRIGATGYCGVNFYHYAMCDGLKTILLGVVTIGWLMRIAATKDGRQHFTVDDAIYGIMTVDGNLGYAKQIATGPALMRLNYLSDHLPNFISRYLGSC